jgi:glycosyltransferase involved in cell wall biosynthesis
MKIIFIGQKGIPAVSGGVEKHVEELSTRLVQSGHEVLVYTRKNYTDKNLKEYRGVKLVSLFNFPTKHLDAISHTFLACLDASFRRKADIIHFHSIGPSSLIWVVKLLNPKTPVVATFHTQCYFHKKWNRFARVYLKFGESVLCRFADRVITVSEVLKKYVKEKYNREAVYIPNGVSIPEIIPAAEIKKIWNLEKSEYILAVSRLVRHKGLQYLIDAYKKISTNKKLVIVGGGFFTDKYVEELKRAAEGNENIIFTGQQSGRVLEELFSNAYLFVQPSESEGLSIALLEAMAYSLPVLVSDIPENKEAIGEMGFIFKTKNSRDLAEKLEKLLGEENLLTGKGELGQAWVKGKYDWEKVTKDIINIYEGLLVGKKKIRLCGLRLVSKFIGLFF